MNTHCSILTNYSEILKFRKYILKEPLTLPLPMILPGLTDVDWEGGICTVNLWLATDTGGATLFVTDTVCGVAVVVINKQTMLVRWLIIQVHLLPSLAYEKLTSKHREVIKGKENSLEIRVK